MKIFKLLSMSILLASIFSFCNLPDSPGLLTQSANHNVVGTIVALTLQVVPTQTQNIFNTPTYAVPTMTASPMPTRITPDTPVWLAYNYTCELAVGGGNMTMNLSWTDRSNREDSYKIYRNENLIATLAANSTFYVDVAFVASGKKLSYSVEAFQENWQESTSTLIYGCQ
jgi:hypothetical protein